MGRWLWLFWRLLRQHILARLSYETDFLLTIGASALTQVLGFVFLQVVFSRIPSVRGWTFWQAALLYGLLLVSRGVAAALGEGAWMIGGAVVMGQLDRLLLRPAPVLLQLYGSGFGWSALADIGLGAALCITSAAHLALPWEPGSVALLCLVLCSGAAVYWSAMLAANAIAFWAPGTNGPVAFLLHGVSELAKFPLAMYPRFLAAVLTWCLPFGLMSFYPAEALLPGMRPGPALWCAPLLGLAAVLVALAVWSAGLRRYEGAGS